jgi:hypothetical protein
MRTLARFAIGTGNWQDGFLHIYIYIYTERERERGGEGERLC